MKIPKWRVKRARQVSLTENGGGGGMLRHTRTLQKRRRDGGDIPSRGEAQAQAGSFLPGRSAPVRGGRMRAPVRGDARSRRSAAGRARLSRAGVWVCSNTCLCRASLEYSCWFAEHEHFQRGRESLWALLGTKSRELMSRRCWATVCISACQQNCFSGKWRLWWAMK